MKRNWLIYIASLVSMSIFAVMYIKYSGFIILVMVAVVPLLYSIIVWFASKKKIDVSFGEDCISMERNKENSIPIIVEQPSELVSGSRAVLRISVNNGVGGTKQIYKKKFIVERNQQRIIFEYVPQCSGIHDICLEALQVCNGFSLLRTTMRLHEKLSCLVMPEYREFPLHPQLSGIENEGESEMFSTRTAGSDPSELYDIRTYRSGDKLNRINWKFTAKNGQMMVQDYGFPIACDTAVFVDIGNEENPKRVECLIEMLYFLAVNYVLAKKMFYVIWKDVQGNYVKRKKITSEEDIMDLFFEIFTCGIGKSNVALEDIYSIQYEGEFLAGCMFLYTGRARLEEEIVRRKLRSGTLEFACV